MKRKVVRAIIAIGCVAVLIWLARMTDAREIVRTVLARIQDLGPWAPFWFIVAYIVACLTFFPGVILTLGSGILFGVWWGTFYVSVGATIGACLAFLTSRYFVRNWLTRKLGNHPKFRMIDEAVAREGWKVAGLMRLSPAFPFTPMNFVFGLTRIPLWQFFIVTYFSIWPMTALFAYLGSLIGDIAQLGTRPVATGSMKWVVTGIGITSTIIVTLVVTRIARRYLAEKLPAAEKEQI